MKKFLGVLLIMALCLSLSACGGETSSGNKIPDVFGISYAEAIAILESEGYEVNAVETSVDSISKKLLYPFEKVEKGTVFKIDDYILDNNGNLNKSYDVFYQGELVSEDKSVVIYYAKEDYITEDISTNSSLTDSTQTLKPDATEEPEKDASNQDGLSNDFKSAMDSYEKFMNEYVSFMKKYISNPSDLGLLADYAEYVSKFADFTEDFEKWDNEEMNAAEMAYYIEVQSRVNKKLLEVTQ